ncbi:MAG: DUF6514 family protein [Clostridia bacterium]|nr:DUF6514 family protein [Clostridia bacterium]
MYSLIVNKTQIDDNGTVAIYGVEHMEDKITDVSSEKETVLRILEQLNSCKVSHIHFKDVVEDLIVQQA